MYQLSYQDTIRETLIEIVGDASDPLQQKQLRTSCETVCDYKCYCHDVCLNIVMDKSDDKIGGPGTHVEIDESKFGKRNIIEVELLRVSGY